MFQTNVHIIISQTLTTECHLTQFLSFIFCLILYNLVASPAIIATHTHNKCNRKPRKNLFKYLNYIQIFLYYYEMESST